MDYRKIAGELGQAFMEHPLDFITEVDLQVGLVQRLESNLREEGMLHAEVRNTDLPGSPRSYKRAYKEGIEDKLTQKGEISRVHTEVSVKQGNRFDVTVFQNSLSNPIKWIQTGSKRFDEDDLEAVFELKYIKNKNYFPVDWPINSEKILKADDEDLKEQLDKTENKIQGDLTELRNLPDHVETYFLLFSNNNYLFHGNLSEKEQEETTKVRVGEVATEWIEEEAGTTSVLYAHPLDSTIWLRE